jgi:glutamine synthetase
MTAEGVRFAHVIYPDLSGTARTKIVPFAKAFAAEGETINALLGSITHADGEPTGDVAFENAFSCDANGYPNIRSLVDPESIVRLGWHPQTASAFLNVYDANENPWAADLRALVSRLERELAELGFTAKFAMEYEFCLFHADATLLSQGRYSELQPFGFGPTNYDLARAPGFGQFVEEFIDRMSSMGIGVASFMSEYGRGMYEFALTPKGPLAAADDAMRAKLYLKEYCAEKGLVATFMTRCRPPGSESASGAHTHQSLYQNDRNAFYSEAAPLRMSGTARHYVGGLLQTLADFHVLFRPTINSYRRLDRTVWSPEDVSWGYENRMCAVRFINLPAEDACRYEHRVPGADANPYAVVAAMLAGGMHGIRERIEPPDACAGDPGKSGAEPLSRTLAESLERFKSSLLAPRLLGAEFVDHFVRSRAAELAAYQTWCAQHITDFEWRRYF